MRIPFTRPFLLNHNIEEGQKLLHLIKDCEEAESPMHLLALQTNYTTTDTDAAIKMLFRKYHPDHFSQGSEEAKCANEVCAWFNREIRTLLLAKDILTLNPTNKCFEFSDFKTPQPNRLPIFVSYSPWNIAVDVINRGVIIPVTALLTSVLAFIVYVMAKRSEYKYGQDGQELRKHPPSLKRDELEYWFIEKRIETLQVKRILVQTLKCIVPFVGPYWSQRTEPAAKTVFGDLPHRYNMLRLKLMPHPRRVELRLALKPTAWYKPAAITETQT